MYPPALEDSRLSAERPRIFVGDVQGCADELDELLERAARRIGADFEVWSVGDLVNRGPDNLRVLERMRALHAEGRARIVLGNHEIGLVQRWLGVRPLGPLDTLQDVLRAPDAADWIAWLRRLPLVETGVLAGQPFALVHAAVHPDWDLPTLRDRARRAEERLRELEPAELRRWLGAAPISGAGAAERDCLDRLTRCRAITDASGAWSEIPPADPRDAWHHRWSERGHGYGVVYGHWSLQDLHVAPGLRGLDTGCVHHDRADAFGHRREGFLTAWIPCDDADRGGLAPFDVPDDRFLRVRGRRRYCDPPQPGG